MKRIAILTTGDAPVGREMAIMLNQGTQYRVGLVPASLANAEFDILLNALKRENVEMLILENYEKQLPDDFPFETMEILPGEDVHSAIQRLSEGRTENAQNIGVTPPPPPPTYEATERNEERTSAYSDEDWEPVKSYEPREEPRKREPMPPTYLVWSIVTTLLCCFIPGVVAIIFSAMVSGRYYSGDIEGAKKASRMAEIWIILSIVLGIISLTLYLPMMMIAG